MTPLYFDISRAPMQKAVDFHRLFPAGLLKFWRMLFFFLGFGSLFIFGIVKLFLYFSMFSEISALGKYLEAFSFIFIPWGLSIWFVQIFAEYYLKHPSVPDNKNIADLYDYDAAHVITRAYSISTRLGEQEVSTTSVLIALLQDGAMAETFRRLGLDARTLSRDIYTAAGGSNASIPSISRLFGSGQPQLSSELLELIHDTHKTFVEHSGDRPVSALDIMASLFDFNEPFKNMMLGIGLDKTDLLALADWYEHINIFRQHKKEFWSLDNLLRKPPIGKDWTYGYAWFLNFFAFNLTDKLKSVPQTLQLVSRTKEIQQVEQLLARAGENNVLLVGEEGVGKRHVIEEFATMVANGETLPALNYKTVFELNIPLVVSSSKSPAEVQNNLIKLLNEAVKAGNVILVIEEFHNFIGEIEGMGRADITNILIPYLRESTFQVIATTDPVSFHKYIEGHAEVTGVFERINIGEPDLDQTMKIMQESLPAIELKTRTLVTYSALKSVVQSGDKYVKTAPFPEKAFNLLSEVISYTLTNRRMIVTLKDVEDVISRKTGIPLGPIKGGEKEKLINLEDIIHKELVGQERAVEVIASTMRRLRTGLSKRGRPAGVFLFVGPTGVGKTQTAKILAKTYFGSEDRMIRFDMSEYQDIASLDRFLGNLRMDEPGQFTTKARDNPFALILLDELEKANKNVLNIFLQVFDEGRLTDVFGRTVSFEQHIIIATSNAGASEIRELIKEGTDISIEKEKVIDVMIRGKYFSPEFLNRFDEIVMFHQLSEDQVYQVAKMALNLLSKRLEEQNYLFVPTDDIVKLVAKVGFDPQFGARPINRAVKDKVENVIANKILEGTIKKGEKFSLTLEDVNG